MSHIYFIHKEDIPAYEAYQKEAEALEKKETELLTEYLKTMNEEEAWIKARNSQNKEYEELREKYKYRSIGLSDKNYSNARALGYVGYYRGFCWDSRVTKEDLEAMRKIWPTKKSDK